MLRAPRRGSRSISLFMIVRALPNGAPHRLSSLLLPATCVNHRAGCIFRTTIAVASARIVGLAELGIYQRKIAQGTTVSSGGGLHDATDQRPIGALIRFPK